MIQMDMFENERMLYILKELKELRDMTDNVRRGLFARYNEIERDVIDLRCKIEETAPGQKQTQAC